MCGGDDRPNYVQSANYCFISMGEAGEENLWIFNDSEPEVERIVKRESPGKIGVLLKVLKRDWPLK